MTAADETATHPPARGRDADGTRRRRSLTAVAAGAGAAVALTGVLMRARGGTPVRSTAVGAIARGAAAGVIGTLAFDLWLYLQYRREGGTESFPDWEFSADVTEWDTAPAPAQVGRRIIEGLTRTELPDDKAAPINNVAHWAYALGGAAAYGVAAGSLRHPRAAYGPLFGAAMWLSGYVILPPLHLYKKITEYDAKTLGKDLAAHLVYGTATAVAFSLLQPRKR